jgi:hypothetical protein
MQSRGRHVGLVTGGGKVPSLCAREEGTGAAGARMRARGRTRKTPYKIADYEKFTDELRG